MAVTSIFEGYTGMNAGGSGRGSKLRRTATRVFTIACDAAQRPIFSWPLTSGAVTIPAPGDAHPDDADLLSLEPHVTAKGPMFFEVSVPYESLPAGGELDPDEQYDDPLSVPAEYSWPDNEEEVPYDTDADGDPILNSMGWPIEGLTKTVPLPTLVIQRNEASFDPDDPSDYKNTVCAEIFWGAAIGRAKLFGFSGQSVAGSTPYWRVRYEIRFRMANQLPTGVDAANAWYRRVLNLSPEYKDGSGNKHRFGDGLVKAIRTSNDQPATASDTDVWLEKKESQTVTWASLSINSP